MVKSPWSVHCSFSSWLNLTTCNTISVQSKYCSRKTSQSWRHNHLRGYSRVCWNSKCATNKFFIGYRGFLSMFNTMTSQCGDFTVVVLASSTVIYGTVSILSDTPLSITTCPVAPLSRTLSNFYTFLFLSGLLHAFLIRLFTASNRDDFSLSQMWLVHFK